MEKKDLLAGHHWVENSKGQIGCVMNGGIVFSSGSIGLGAYDKNLTCHYLREDTIVKVYEVLPKKATGTLDNNLDLRLIAEMNALKMVKTLSQLEEMCAELSTRVGDLFYMTNRNGKWEVKRDTLMGDVIVADEDFKDFGYNVLVNCGK